MPPISDELAVPVTVGATPASPNGVIPARSGEIVTLHADLTKEYVAGSGYTWYAQYLRSLPFYIDDISADFGDDIYERMLQDAQVAADVMRLKAAILEDGVTLTNAISDETEDGYALGATITDTLTSMFADLETPLDDVLWNLLDAIALGNRVAEQKYAYQTILGKRVLALTALKVKPRRNTSFLVDAYGDVKGLLGVLPTGFSPIMIGSVLSDISQQPNLIAREKFAVLTFRPKDNDPRGSSILRPAYSPWWLKRQVIGEYVKYLTQFASPSLLGFTSPTAQQQPQQDALGNPVLNPSTGAPVMQAPEQVMNDALVGFHNGTVATFHGDAKVQLVQSSGNGRPFELALQFFNREIGKAITTQSLATEEGQHDARAAATVHQDALDTLVRQQKTNVERMVRYDILCPIVKYTWGEDIMRKLTPTVSCGNVEEHDFRQEGETVARLYAVGYIGESQKAKLDERLGLPERDLDYDRLHETPIVRATPARVTPIEGGPPQPDATQRAQLQSAAAAAQVATQGQPRQKAVAA